jgi:hypothetical protein
MTLVNCWKYHEAFGLDGAMFLIHSKHKRNLPAVWSDLRRGAFVVPGIDEEFLVSEADNLANHIDCECIE